MKKTKNKKQRAKPVAEETLAVILLDRTGSMADRVQETIGGFNGFLDELEKDPDTKGVRISFTQFDTVGTDHICERLAVNKVSRLTEKTYEPRGGTNLYDAIGELIKRVEGYAGKDKVIFTILTDGQENSSSAWTLDGIRSLIKTKEKDGWTFTYIGVGPDAWAATQLISKGTIGASNTLRSSNENYGATYTMAKDAVKMRVTTAGGQSLCATFGGKQLDKDDE